MLTVAGIELLPPLQIFAQFAIAGLLLNLVPGQDMLFVIATGARLGRRSGVIAALGIGAGAFFHIIAATIGISALIAASASAFLLLKTIGVAYLLWLALAFLREPAAAMNEDRRASDREWAIFRSAALVSITNPKVALFFLAFLPQFVSVGARMPALEILCLGLWFDIVGTLVNVVAGLGSAALAARAAGRVALFKYARWGASVALALLALRLAFAERR